MRFIDFFAGIGGFRRGMELAGHECVGFCEFDKYATASYVSMHCITDEQREYLNTLDLRKRQKEILKEEYRNGEWYASDIRDVEPEDVPEAECYCFGFPCQAFSIAGNRRGFEDTRGTLFFEVMRIAKERHPSILFAENVKGLLNHDKGQTFQVILETMDELGYDAEWEVLNSKYFGVPQNRERCFIIGRFRGCSGSKIFPLERTDGEDSVRGLKQIAQMYGTDVEPNPMAGRVYDTEMSPSLDTCQSGNRMPKIGIEVVGTLDEKRHSQMDVMSGDGICQTLDTLKERKKIAIPVLTPDRPKRQNGRRFKEDGEEAFTITSRDRHGVAVGVDVDKGEVEIRNGLQEHQKWKDDGTSPALTAAMGMGGGYTPIIKTVVDVSGNKVSESDDIARCLNANDQCKVFGANQKRTMVAIEVDKFAIDKGVEAKEREVANCIESREDRGISNRSQEGTLIYHKIK